MDTQTIFRWLIQISIVFIVGFVVARNHLVVGAIGSGFASPYETFYSNITDTDDLFYNRSCKDVYTLEERKKVRWVIQKAKDTLFNKSYESFGARGLAVSFLSLHALFVVLCFVFIRLTVESILGNAILSARIESFMLLLFLTLTLFVFNGKVSEFSYSIIDGACLSAALYFSRVRKIIPFVFIVSFAVLNRESGFLIIALWFAFNPKMESRLFYLLIPFLLFTYVNYDILICMRDPAFYMGSNEYRPYQSFNGVGDVISFIGAIIFNYAVFFVLFSAVLYLSKTRGVSYMEIKHMYLVYVLYSAVFIIFTPVSHMSIKYIIIPLIVVASAIYRSKYIFHGER